MGLFGEAYAGGRITLIILSASSVAVVLNNDLLESLPAADVVGMSRRLDALLAAVDTLPLALEGRQARGVEQARLGDRGDLGLGHWCGNLRGVQRRHRLGRRGAADQHRGCENTCGNRSKPLHGRGV